MCLLIEKCRSVSSSSARAQMVVCSNAHTPKHPPHSPSNNLLRPPTRHPPCAQALRTCPVCRTTSHFIVPSLVWPSSAAEKERLVEGYKAKLSTIDCRLFDYGEGGCAGGGWVGGRVGAVGFVFEGAWL